MNNFLKDDYNRKYCNKYFTVKSSHFVFQLKELEGDIVKVTWVDNKQVFYSHYGLLQVLQNIRSNNWEIITPEY